MADQTYSGPILLSGDMVAALTGQPSNVGNPGDPNFAMRVQIDGALGAPSDLYRLVWYQNVNTTDTHFSNGQRWRLEQYDPEADADGDPATGDGGWSAVAGFADLTPKPDLIGNGAQALGDGDEYIVFQSNTGQFLIYDLNGNLPITPTEALYTFADQNGDPALGDNDYRLDFSDMYAHQPVPCFVEGTPLDTPGGPRRVETLAVGDLVLTRDHGAQPVRWIDRSRVFIHAGNRALAPVTIATDALGPGLPRQEIRVSPRHRVLLAGPEVELATGEAEALAPARTLVGQPGITWPARIGPVVYWHLLFDRHEIVTSAGIGTESFYPGDIGLGALSPGTRAEILALFPDLAAKEWRGYGPTARRVLRAFEVRAVMAGRAPSRVA